MNEERTWKCLRQVEHIRGHLWHRYFIRVNQVMLISVVKKIKLYTRGFVIIQFENINPFYYDAESQTIVVVCLGGGVVWVWFVPDAMRVSDPH